MVEILFTKIFFQSKMNKRFTAHCINLKSYLKKRNNATEFELYTFYLRTIYKNKKLIFAQI